MREVLAPYSRLDVPRLYPQLTSARLLVMEEIHGVSIHDAQPEEARRQAARQLLEAYCRQVLTDGFFHADPHPGNLMWWNGKIYLLDLGMVGQVDPELRELLMLMLMAFAQDDAGFLTDLFVSLSSAEHRSDLDLEALEADLGALMARQRGLSLREISLGAILQEMTEIAVRHDVALPASLALTGKAFGQVQLTAAELDPTIDPFAVAGEYVMKGLRQQIRERVDPRRFFYAVQRGRVRGGRLVQAVESLLGARPGPKLQVEFQGIDRLEREIARAGQRIALAITAAAALMAAGMAANGRSRADSPRSAQGARRRGGRLRASSPGAGRSARRRRS